MDKQYPVRQWAHGADLVVSQLEAQGVRQVFGIPGAKIDKVFDSLLDSSIRIIPVRHEANAAFMAAAVGRITGKAGVALVTSGPGCSNLITGMATANSEGDPVVALGGAVKRADKAKQVHQSMDTVAMFSPVTKYAVEVTAPDALAEVVSNAFRAAEQALGRVDVLVSNAGIAQQKLFTDITPEEWQRMLDVNLTGAFNLCQLALPGMIRRKAGRILTVSSMWGQTGGSCEVHYSAAKAGLIGLTKALAKEEGPSGITVNCVAPGVIDTDMMASFTAEDKAALAEETPVGRLGTAEEVAKLLLYLAGEDAGYITGQVFGVNGGLVI